MCTILGMVSPLRQQETSLLDLSTHDLVFVSNKITKLYLPSQVLFLHSEKKAHYVISGHMKIFFGEWRLYIYLRPLLATTINI